MEQNKLQKIAGAIISILIIGGVFGYKFYTNYTVKQTNKFVDSYNAFTSSFNIFVTAFEAKVDENGKLRTPATADPVINNSKKLSDTGCGYITKSDIKKNCIELFKDFSNSFQNLKDNGYNEELDKKFKDLDEKLSNFEKELTEKLGVEFR